MKVLHIIASIDESAGGPSRSVPKTCIELAKMGVDIEIITQPSPNPVKIPKNENLKLVYKSIKALNTLGSNLKKVDVDLIHIQHIWNPYVNVMAYWARKKNIPYIITPRGMLEPWILACNPWKKKLGMWLYQNTAIRKANHLHATAQMEADNIRKLGYKTPITNIPNGIDLSEIKTVKTNYGTKKMVFLSRIHPKKGIELLLEAWRTMDSKEWTLEIAGDGDPSYVETLKKSASDLKEVRFIGPQYGEAKWDCIRSADVMVLPTFSENFGIVVAEALAVGVPVLTTMGTPWEDLETHRCGWWIELSVANLKNTLEKVVKSPLEEFEAMGKRGTVLVKEKYDTKAVAEHMSALYNKIILK
jgi:glycosyltransferase involved in cell wall biosynthesis